MSTPETDAPTPVAELSYEQARDELVRLVARIESGQVPLEESMLLWERGEQLAAHCQAKLDAAQDTLDRATGQGQPVTPDQRDPSGGAEVEPGQDDLDAQEDEDDAGGSGPTG